jgi:hypothetical protein
LPEQNKVRQASASLQNQLLGLFKDYLIFVHSFLIIVWHTKTIKYRPWHENGIPLAAGADQQTLRRRPRGVEDRCFPAISKTITTTETVNHLCRSQSALSKPGNGQWLFPKTAACPFLFAYLSRQAKKF